MPAEDMHPTYIAMCESKTHAAMLDVLVNRDGIAIEHILTTGTFEQLGAVNVPVTALPSMEANTPEKAWALAQETTRSLLSSHRLLQFQDQGWLAQAVSMAAQSAGTHRTILQDGYLSFDIARSVGARRHTWPISSRMDRIDPATPRPRLRSRLNRLLYRNHHFGITRPDTMLVFGAAMKTRMIRQWRIDAGRIHVTGPLLRPKRVPERPNTPQANTALRVLFLDQCFLRYGRMSPTNWGMKYLPLIQSLRPHDLTVKLHPAQPRDLADDVIEAAGPTAHIMGRELLSDLSGQDFDVAVTVSSTSFLSCIAAGIPVIFCDCGALDVMPDIAHPSIRNCASPGEVSHLLEAMARTRTFQPNAGGDALEAHIALAADCTPSTVLKKV